MKNGFSNAWNPSNSKYYCEWWYFILFDEKLGTFSGCFSITGDCTKNPRGHLWMNVYPGSKRKYFVVPDRDVIASKSKVDIKLGKDRFYEEAGKTIVKIDESIIKIDISAKKSVELEDNFSRIKSGSGSIEWLIPMIRGEYSGTITHEGKQFESKGIMFHDHVRLNFKDASDFKKLSSLSWGVKFENKKGFVFADIVAEERLKTLIVQEGRKVKRINMIDGDMENTMSIYPNSVKAVCKGKLYEMNFSSSELNKSAKNFFVQKIVDTRDCVSHKQGKNFSYEYIEILKSKRGHFLAALLFIENLIGKVIRKKK